MTRASRTKVALPVRPGTVLADRRLGRFGPAFWRRARDAAQTAGASASRRWFRFLRLSFVCVVVAPTALAILYIAAVASPQFTSEARIAVRGSLEPAPGQPEAGGDIPATGRLDGLFGGRRESGLAQDPFILTSLVSSRSMVAELDRNDWLREKYSREGIDGISALSTNPTFEALWRYWNRHVTAAVDRRSNIVLLRVLAFSPEEAQEIASRVIDLSERRLNELNDRARSDTLRASSLELQRAQKTYEAALARSQEWRVRQASIDPRQAADALGANLLRLEQERIAASRELDVLRRLAASDSPSRALLLDRVHALDAEIARVQRRISETTTDDRALVSSLAQFEKTELDRQFAETMLAIATRAHQNAEKRANRQGIFASVFVPPTLADQPSLPIWWETGLFVFLIAGIAWINTMILLSIVRDHRN